MPNRSIAARVSPPPAIENASLSAMALATISVPLRKFGNSNTPTGPFHRMVFAFFRMSASCCAEASPISRICSSSFTSLTDFRVAGAVSENSVATRTSVGTDVASGQQTLSFVNEICFVQGFTHVVALSSNEGVRDTTANDQLVSDF